MDINYKIQTTISDIEVGYVVDSLTNYIEVVSPSKRDEIKEHALNLKEMFEENKTGDFELNFKDVAFITACLGNHKVLPSEGSGVVKFINRLGQQLFDCAQ